MIFFRTIARANKHQVCVTDIKVIQMQCHGIQSLVKVAIDASIYRLGAAEVSAVMTRAYLYHLKHKLIGQNPLEIEKLPAIVTHL